MGISEGAGDHTRIHLNFGMHGSFLGDLSRKAPGCGVQAQERVPELRFRFHTGTEGSTASWEGQLLGALRLLGLQLQKHPSKTKKTGGTGRALLTALWISDLCPASASS